MLESTNLVGKFKSFLSGFFKQVGIPTKAGVGFNKIPKYIQDSSRKTRAK